MGPRYPDSRFSQRRFRTLFVLLESPNAPASPQHEAKVAAFAANFGPYFDRATGGRGSTVATLPVTPSAAFTTSTAGPRTIQFHDTSATSADYPTSWNWSFGDGLTSTAQHPRHTWAAPGRYPVTLEVRNSRGTSTTTTTVDVTAAGRTRAVRH
jgi:PKD repeat protein